MNRSTVGETISHLASRITDAGIGDARLEAEVLLAFALGVERAHLLAELRSPLDDAAQRGVEALLTRRLQREPLAYIVGEREFFGITIRCTPSALIPRPETEPLVEIALEECRARDGRVDIADVGTGTGAIAIAVAAHAPNASATAIDASEGALALAIVNGRAAGVDASITFVHGDLLEGVGTFDIILANLPYVTEGEWTHLEPEIRDWEPRTALVGGRTGTEVIERLLATSRAHVRPNGLLVAEIGAEHGQRLTSTAREHFPEARIDVRTDLSGLDRALVVRLPAYTRR